MIPTPCRERRRGGHDFRGRRYSVVGSVIFSSDFSADHLSIERSATDAWTAVLTPYYLVMDPDGSSSYNLSDTDSLTISGEFYGGGVEKFLFADGSIWTQKDLERAYIAQHVSDEADDVFGFSAMMSSMAEAGMTPSTVLTGTTRSLGELATIG